MLTAADHAGWSDVPPSIVPLWAARVADRFDVTDPQAALGRSGVALRVCRAPLSARGLTIYGAWDPLLRRIELFCCDAGRGDTELARALGHELWHMMEDARRKLAGRPITAPRAESAAERFAAAWLERLGPERVRRCAAALRAQAGSDRVQTGIAGTGILNIGA